MFQLQIPASRLLNLKLIAPATTWPLYPNSFFSGRAGFSDLNPLTEAGRKTQWRIYFILRQYSLSKHLNLLFTASLTSAFPLVDSLVSIRFQCTKNAYFCILYCIFIWLRYFADWFWQLLASHPTSGPGSSLGTIGKLGFTHVEATVQALVETFHAFTATPDAPTATPASPVNDGAGCKEDKDTRDNCVSFAAKVYSELLMAENIQVSLIWPFKTVTIWNWESQNRYFVLHSASIRFCFSLDKILFLNTLSGLCTPTHPCKNQI